MSIICYKLINFCDKKKQDTHDNLTIAQSDFALTSNHKLSYDKFVNFDNNYLKCHTKHTFQLFDKH